MEFHQNLQTHSYDCYQGSRNFKLKIGLDNQVTKYPPPPPPPKKKTTKNVVAKTNDIMNFDSRCITTFSELSKVFFHVILKKKPKLRTVLTFLISVHKQEMTAQRLGRKMVHMKNILTYRNNPSYTSMGILIFLSVRSNTDQIRMKLRLFQAHLMCSRNRVLTYSWTS